MRKLLCIIAVLFAAGTPIAPIDDADAQAPRITIGASARQTAAPLLDQLKTAKDEPSAQALEAQIWNAWSHSGDDEVDSLMLRSVALMHVQAYDDALAVLDTVVAKAPDFAEGWNKRATLLYIMKEYDRSLADIGHVLALEPRHFGALAGVGLIQLAKGDNAGALVAYQRVLDVDPFNGAARTSIEALGKDLQGNPI